ncbi:Two-component system sensor histidine kinase [Flavobacterium indicum GPTSA100-9 = DSM 17447]|uniref:histidine kinase n=1 Tax=Flavobacterium indicum (strain DSM 17447 / CIP 109464 / GPTSA100-9) TaxID=1094466 RepID=H8XNN0_FLAIG|nr:ATP-binding protein [Flavobacterium indicum]CCG52147.1 Two-component system sensor histidine kinase [Flavobacterium indicum GPTSA100-9 = DSM 17447]
MFKWYQLSGYSLRQRIFLSMILLTIFSSILISLVSVYHFRYEAREYHEERLSRKENSIKQHIEYILKNTPHKLTEENTFKIFRNKIFELSDIHGLEVNFFNLKGRLILSSNPYYYTNNKTIQLRKETLNKLTSSSKQRILFVRINEDKQNIISSYSFIKNNNFKNFAILNIPYVESNDFYNEEVQKFLERYLQVYVLMLIISIYFSFALSKTITKSLTQISEKLEITQLNQRNEKLTLQPGDQEINALINAYNTMVDKLEESAQKLAQNEREHAWREMAKQVAHEIKNPLTPMKLTVQSFQRRFNPEDPAIIQKLNDYSETLIQQIDTMTAVASAFSNFASMPAQENESLNMVKVAKIALEIFNEEYIQFIANDQEIIIHFDKTQLVRIVTNLVKNAIQAIPKEQENKIVQVILEKNNDKVKLFVVDNGVGIEEEKKLLIFEPKFTTKTSGMGLGLAIIKNIVENYDGIITFESELGKGSTFCVELPIK